MPVGAAQRPRTLSAGRRVERLERTIRHGKVIASARKAWSEERKRKIHCQAKKKKRSNVHSRPLAGSKIKVISVYLIF